MKKHTSFWFSILHIAKHSYDIWSTGLKVVMLSMKSAGIFAEGATYKTYLFNKSGNMSKLVNVSSFLLALVTITLLTNACSKSFLEEPSRTVTIDDLINNPQDGAQRVLGAVYNRLYDWETHGFSWIGVSSITSDEADKGSSPGDGGADKIEMDAWALNPTNLSFNEVWEGHFEGIGRACNAIEFISQMDLPAAEKDRYLADAKFLRAYHNWVLVRCFGGIPKIDKVLASQADIERASIRASADEIYDFIEKDLNEAIPALPMTISPSEYGRPAKGAAQAFLAKVFLYRKKWADSKALCDQVINSGLYSLMPDYAKIWREAGEFSSESLWEINAITTNPARGIVGYSEVQGIRGSGDEDYGWGFNVPSESLVNAYEPGDKRKAGTVLVSGTMLWDGFQTSANLPNKYYNYKAFCSKTQETNFDRNQSNKNLRVFRYGDLLLIKAEVENELGDTTAALGALNQIRQRAGLGDVIAQNQSNLRQLIYKERHIEMAMEHDRTFDLRRTGRAGAVLRALGKNYVDGKHDVFPIPQRQIDLSGGKLLQNPGY